MPVFLIDAVFLAMIGGPFDAGATALHRPMIDGLEPDE
jgi:hypothetical protein